MRNLLMLMLSTVAAAALGATLWHFLSRLRRIEREFWGEQLARVDEGIAPVEQTGTPES